MAATYRFIPKTDSFSSIPQTHPDCKHFFTKNLKFFWPVIGQRQQSSQNLASCITTHSGVSLSLFDHLAIFLPDLTFLRQNAKISLPFPCFRARRRLIFVVLFSSLHMKFFLCSFLRFYRQLRKTIKNPISRPGIPTSSAATAGILATSCWPSLIRMIPSASPSLRGASTSSGSSTSMLSCFS